MESKQQNFWRMAASAGLILGLLLITLSGLSYMFGKIPAVSVFINLFEFAAIIFIIWYTTRKYAQGFIKEGFSYARSLGFIITLMVFTGFIAGFGQYFLQVKIAPEYYQSMLDQAMEATQIPIDKEYMNQAEEMSKNIIFISFSWVMSMALYGGLIGMVMSVFLKRPPMVQNNEQ